MRMLLLLSFLISNYSIACDGGLNLNKNQISIPVGSPLANTITEAQYRHAMRSFETFFGPGIERELNKELIVISSWSSNTVNAYAEQDDGKFLITLYGGLARHKDITLDGLTASLCHELGHHLGGYPKKSTNKWSSAEGQSDYFATMKCLRKIWEKEDNLAAIKNDVIPPALKLACETTSKTKTDRALCQRS